jgi:hypothetical protein
VVGRAYSGPIGAWLDAAWEEARQRIGPQVGAMLGIALPMARPILQRLWETPMDAEQARAAMRELRRWLMRMAEVLRQAEASVSAEDATVRAHWERLRQQWVEWEDEPDGGD